MSRSRYVGGLQVLAQAAGAGVSRPFPSWNRFILTEISLCHACSCQERLRTETAGQGELPGPAQARLCFALPALVQHCLCFACERAAIVGDEDRWRQCWHAWGALADVRAALPWCMRPIVAEIYLCHARSPQAMLRVEHAPAL
eukprot:COSAG01_NODE_1142_length_11533_cov_9.907381_11_plen_143_part_00